MAPDLHGDDPEQCVGVGPASGSRDESEGPVPGVEVVAPTFVDEMIKDLFEVSPVVPQSREPEEYLEKSSDGESRESGEPARNRRRLSPEVENPVEDTAPFP